MYTLHFLASIAYLLIYFSNTLATGCGIDPELWCNSVENAKKCEVLHVCFPNVFDVNTDTDVQPVQVGVYFESYCPDSIKFLTTQLYPTYETLKSTGIIDIYIVPYGKASYVEQPDETYKFTCQHGVKECYGNTIENCLLKYTNEDVATYLPVIQCMELPKKPNKYAQQCIEKAGLDWKSIQTCAQGKEGNELFHDAGVKTEALDPALKWVPWIVLNGEHDVDIQTKAINGLLKLVCDTYKGVKPAECKTSARKIRFE